VLRSIFLALAGAVPVDGGKEPNMPKPPATPPHSELDGVDEDAARNTDAALASGQDSGNLELARKQAAAKPAHSSNKSKDDRSS
jgi:hypothetical protein